MGLPCAALVTFAICGGAWLLRDGREPPGFFCGASSWQSLAVFVGAIVCGVHFIARLSLVLARNEDYLVRTYGLHDDAAAPTDRDRWWLRSWRWLTIQWRPCCESLTEQQLRDAETAEIRDPIVSADTLWAEHRRLGKRFQMLWRALVPTALTVALTAMTFAMSPAPPLPWRSASGEPGWFLGTLILAHSLGLQLLFLVTAEVLRACGFVRRLDAARTLWAGEAGARTTVDDIIATPAIRVRAESHDIHFIEARTRALGPIITFPLIMMILLLVARNRYFDDWPTPAGVILQFSIFLLITTPLSWLLHRTAEDARKSSLHRLDEEARRARGRNDRVLLKQIDKTKADVEKLHEGAYATFWKQPAVYGVIVGSGGLGITTLIPLLTRLF